MQPKPLSFGSVPATVYAAPPVAQSPLMQVVEASTPTPSRSIAVITDAEIDQLGQGSASRVADTSRKILESVRASDTEGFGQKLNELVSTAKQLDPSKMGKPGLIKRVLGFGGAVKEKMLAEYQTVEARMNVLSDELDKMAALMTKRVEDCEKMFVENEQTYVQLKGEVARGKQMHADMEVAIKAFGQPTDPFELQKLADLQARADRLLKRVDDFERGMLIATNAAPEIRMQQAHNRALAQSVRDIKATTIPAWMGVFSRYVIAMEAKKGAELIHSVYDATDAAFRQQADLMRENSRTVAQAQQRSVVSTETLEHMQKQLIGAVDDALKIAEDGRKAREQAKPKLKQLETELYQRFAVTN